MNLDELRDIQNRERTTNSLQELRDSFYADVADYIQGLKEERERAASEADDPFSNPEVSRLTDEIEMAEQVSEAIYERRVGKIVKQASLAAADMQNDPSGFTAEEERLYEDLVERIGQNKSRVLDVLAGDADGASAASDAGEAREPQATDEASRSAPSAGSSDAGEARDPPAAGTADAPARSDPSGEPVSAAGAMGGDENGTESADAGPPSDPRAPDGGGEGDEEEERSTVRITQDVGEIFGVDERVYSLESEDVVHLPEANAAPLVEREAAERL